MLNINLDMIGTYMGKFICLCFRRGQAGTLYILYGSRNRLSNVEAKTGVYSSDSTPFADSGIPALSFARIASSECGTNSLPL